MITKDFIIIFQETAKEFGLVVNREEVGIVLDILEEALLRTGSQLDNNEKLLIGRFIELVKVDSPPRTGKIMKGKDKGKTFISAPNEYVDFRATKGFRKKSKKPKGEMRILE